MYAVTNPATGEVEERYETFTDGQVEQAVSSADRIWREWSQVSSLDSRIRLMHNVVEIYMRRRDELADIIHHEMGKSLEEAAGEVEFSAQIYAYYADHARELLADMPVDRVSGGTAVVRKLPVGPLLGIMPWNYPYYQVARFAGPNLLIGNTVVLKHASLCPKSSAAMEAIFLEAGFPKGAFVNVYASIDQVTGMIADPRIRGVSLTGSERAGRQVAAEAGRALKKVVCELGGSDPFIVMSADDLDETVRYAVAARYENVGQICNGAKRFIVVNDLYDDFLSRFAEASRALDLAPMCSEAAAAHLSRQVHQALDEGARLVIGDPDNRGASFSPTILADIPEDASARREEFFGPVAQFYRVSDAGEALRVANDSPYGLGSYVFTTDTAEAEFFADGIQAGMTYVNEAGADSAELPFGGVKNSGFGREMGELGMREFVNLKLITRHEED
ncbi:NAD-dependent succinate-semialdehyde dehydrogenase [uncultured Bifidobacterium sp.]|uniref:NAD-dependent succinate-semialdehyde dehydrogenase n=1 Tax=uncultured Bifidobacterium sp. TaxID=165187 RepID=UPI0028DB2170|nr:NAD-dependent succinate-semialdehyde dehydrogenase [uncultured Bifidobacterium sp.]